MMSNAAPSLTAQLNDSQVSFYRTNGFLQVNDLLTAAEIEELRNLTDETNTEIIAKLPPASERGIYGNVFLQVVNVWQRNPAFTKFTLHPRLASAAKALLGCQQVRLWHDHLMTKLPGADNRPTDWHQDFPYWPMKQPGPLSIWIPLQDVNWDNGCMHFVPGSHDWGLNEVVRLDQADKADIFSLIRDKSPPEIQRTYVPLKAGSVTFHNGLTIHAAGKNLSDQPRRVLSIIYMPDGEIYDGRAHVVSDQAKDLVAGQPFHGDLFPVIPTE